MYGNQFCVVFNAFGSFFVINDFFVHSLFSDFPKQLFIVITNHCTKSTSHGEENVITLWRAAEYYY